MQRSTMIAVVFGASLLMASHLTSAAALSMNPDACVLVSGTSPYPQMSCAPGTNNCATGGGGQFTNNSGGYAWAMCPMAWQDGYYNFMVATSSTTAACYLVVSASGGGNTAYGGTRSGNQVYFNVALTAGSYSAEVQCWIPNGSAVWYSVNY